MAGTATSDAARRHLHDEVVITPDTFGEYLGNGLHRFRILRLDLFNQCNVQCVYCPSYVLRTGTRLDLEAFAGFLRDQVLGIRELIFGCTMEPTLHPQLGEFMELVASSRVGPRKRLALATNGTLLHRHDHAAFRRAGLRDLYLSVDTANQETLSTLRKGTDLARVRQNLLDLKRECPRLRLHINVVVTRLNLPEIEDLIAWGTALRCEHFVLREVFTPTESDAREEIATNLSLLDGQFDALKRDLLDRFGDQAAFTFADKHALEDKHYRRQRGSGAQRYLLELGRHLGNLFSKPRSH